jgi:DNA-binding transcriptional MerR regulator
MQQRLRIGDLARSAGVNVETVRYYERVGLLPRVSREANGYRSYGEQDRARLQIVRQAKGLGLSLDEIKQTLALLDEACCATVRPTLAGLLETKIADLDARISALRALRGRLERQRQLVLERSADEPSEASCTPGTCACLEEPGASPIHFVEDLRRAPRARAVGFDAP